MAKIGFLLVSVFFISLLPFRSLAATNINYLNSDNFFNSSLYQTTNGMKYWYNKENSGVVGKNKTFIMFAPQHSHSVMSKGRKCESCHSIETVNQQLENKELKLTWIKNNKSENMKEIIPVFKDGKYKFAYQEYFNRNWSIIKKYKKLITHYAGFGSPLSKEQLEKMSVSQSSK